MFDLRSVLIMTIVTLRKIDLNDYIHVIVTENSPSCEAVLPSMKVTLDL